MGQFKWMRTFKGYTIPLSSSHVFIHDVKDDILTITSGFTCYLAQLSLTDLFGVT